MNDTVTDTGADTTVTQGDGGDTANTNTQTNTPADTTPDTQVSTSASHQGEDKENNQDKPQDTQPEGDAKPKDGEKSDGEEKPDEGKDKPEGSVEYTDFKVPEGFEMNQEMLGKFVPVAQEAGLSQEAAQQFIDIHAEAINSVVSSPDFRESVYQQLHRERMDKWANAAIDDNDVGGENSKQALATALTAVESLKVPGLMELVTDPELGFGNHVKAVKFFEGLGRHIKSHGFESGGAGGGNARAADVLYGNNNVNE